MDLRQTKVSDLDLRWDGLGEKDILKVASEDQGRELLVTQAHLWFQVTVSNLMRVNVLRQRGQRAFGNGSVVGSPPKRDKVDM
jgi:hypothetical protein